MYRLYKIQKLCSQVAIDRLFDRHDTDVSSSVAYPLRVVWRLNGVRTARCPRFLISVPKRKLRHAVDRVKMRRRIREAYRLAWARHLDAQLPVDMAFTYVAPGLADYAHVCAAMERLLGRIAKKEAERESKAPQTATEP